MPSPSSTPANTIRQSLTPNSKNAISGACAGILTSLITCPLDVVKTRLQAQINSLQAKTGGLAVPSGELYRGIAASLRRIWNEEGIRGLYRGLGPTMLGYLPTWAVYFPVYEQCKHLYAAKGRPEYRIHIASAMTAGVASAIATNPIWVVKTRLMTQPRMAPSSYRSTYDCARRITVEEGLRTFYSGLLPSLFGVSHVVVQFPALEYLKHALQPDDWPPKDQHFTTQHHANPLPLPMHRLILAIILSKALASGATYPHEVLRTRLQNQRGGITHPDAKYKGLLHALRTVLHEEGIRGLYSGFGVNLVRTVPSSVVTILGFEAVRSWLGD